MTSCRAQSLTFSSKTGRCGKERGFEVVWESEGLPEGQLSRHIMQCGFDESAPGARETHFPLAPSGPDCSLETTRCYVPIAHDLHQFKQLGFMAFVSIMPGSALRFAGHTSCCCPALGQDRSPALQLRQLAAFLHCSMSAVPAGSS